MPSEWTVEGVIDRVGQLIETSGLPSPNKPGGLGKTYDFPTEPSTLELLQLGRLRLQLASYLGYTKLLLGQEELAHVALKKVFEIKLDVAAHGYIRGWDQGGRAPGREIAQSLALDASPDLKVVYRDLIEREARVTKLRTQCDIYQVQLDALSREQSRRESENRV